MRFILPASLCLLTIVLVSSCSTIASLGCYSKRRQSEAVIQKIENFRKKHHRLPESLSEMGIPESEEGPIYYRKVDETKYRVRFGTTLGESVIYDSDKRFWEP